MATKLYDKIIIGAGLYGLYAAHRCGQAGQKVLILEYDPEPFMRATYINQARVHMGYHYPRSLSTATKSAGYYRRFHEDYMFAIHDQFRQIYATSGQFSWTNAEEFVAFCRAANIRCEEVSPKTFFRDGLCDGAFLTEEDTYDARILRDFFLDELAKMPNVELTCNARLTRIVKESDVYAVTYGVADDTGADAGMSATQGKQFAAEAPFLLNATYASTNQILSMVEQGSRASGDTVADGVAPAGSFEPFRIKYELCEIILCKTSEELRDIGLTVMDGPFFSIMPFGKTGLHSLTAVTFTPHVTSFDTLPSFTCQAGTQCSREQLCNCNDCPHRPASAWPYMSHLADKYMKPEYSYTYEQSLFSMKPILKSSEVDDSRPTAIRVNSEGPTMISVLSGKINTVYDLDEYL